MAIDPTLIASIGQAFLEGQGRGLEEALIMDAIGRDVATRNALAQYVASPEAERRNALNQVIAADPATASTLLTLEQTQNELARLERQEQARREYAAAQYVLSSESPALALRLLDEDGTFQQQLVDAGLIDPEDGISDEEARIIAEWARDTTAPIAGVQVATPESPFAKIDPADYTPESIAEFERTGEFSALRRRPEDVEPSEAERKLAIIRSEFGRDPTPAEVARVLGIEPKDDDDVLSEQIKPTDLHRVRLPDGTSPPLGTTWGEARAMGAKVYSTEELKRERDIEDAMHLLDQLESLAFSEGVFLDAGGSILTENVLARSVRGILNGLGALAGTDAAKRRAVFDANARGTLARIVRAMGESGALAEGDIQRAIALLPRLGAVPQTERQARMHFQELRAILSRGAENLERRAGDDGATQPAGPIDLGGGVTVEFLD
jgi:hypothetical protein